MPLVSLNLVSSSTQASYCPMFESLPNCVGYLHRGGPVCAHIPPAKRPQKRLQWMLADSCALKVPVDLLQTAVRTFRLTRVGGWGMEPNG